MVLVKGSLPATSTNDRSEKIIGKRNKYKMKILNPNISKNLNNNNLQPVVLVKGSLPVASTNDRSEKIIGKRNKYKMKILNQNNQKLKALVKALSLSAVFSMPNIVKHGLHVCQ